MSAEDFLDEVTKSDEPPWLKEFRLDSFKSFENSRPENTELLKHQTLFNDFELGEFQTTTNKNPTFPFSLSDEAAYSLQDSDGIKINLPVSLKQNGVIVSSLDNFKNDTQFKQILVSNSKVDDKFLQLNNALFKSGLYIHIPRDVQVETPLRLITSVNSHLINKVILVLEPGSKLRVIKEDYSNDTDNSMLYSDSVEVVLKDGSELHFSHLQVINKNTVHLSNKISTCHRDSRINFNIGYFGGKKVRSRVHNILLGEGSEANDLEILFGNKNQQFDVYSTLLHTGKNTSGRVISNGVLRDNAVSIFKGMIKISEGAKNSNSFLSEHGMLLSKDARAKAIPSLEIETNEVKATHSASVSQIEDDKIFYLMSRGLNEEQSKKLITFGFFEPVIQKMFLEEIKTKIYHLLELKWQGKEDEFLNSFDKLEVQESEGIKKKEDMFSGHYKYR